MQCVLTPELTEGPYYIAGEKVRRDIRDGHPGKLLTLRLRVLDVSLQADQGRRGRHLARGRRRQLLGLRRGCVEPHVPARHPEDDASGLAVFTTIYPGWYQGRAVHIHVKVHVGGRVVHTGQLFFNDSLTDAVYRAAPYSSRPNRDVRNAQDSIFVNGGKRGLLAVTKDGAGYVGTIAMGVHR